MSQTTDLNTGSPPPYEEDRRRASNDEAPPSEEPPAYDAGSEATQPPADVKVRPAEQVAQTTSRTDSRSGNHAGPSSSSSAAASSSSSMNPMNLVQSYKDKRRAKEAAKKVDFYEKMYGFVPKNAMTEAEWRDARARAPQVKKPVKLGARQYFGTL